mmetsp:Transcript_2506/g.4271  ORF Transcript_2506/g.4271 Transcript_2506/m.4271 type:complete len:168 (+) Transcript_2506:270-773(+)
MSSMIVSFMFVQYEYAGSKAEMQSSIAAGCFPFVLLHNYVGLHRVGPSKGFAAAPLSGVTAGGLHPLASFASLRSLPILTQSFICAEFRLAFGIPFGVTVLYVGFQLCAHKGIHVQGLGLSCRKCNGGTKKGHTFAQCYAPTCFRSYGSDLLLLGLPTTAKTQCLLG